MSEQKAVPFGYLVGQRPVPDAPIRDNPSGLYCRACRSVGFTHCAAPDYCGALEPMAAASDLHAEGGGNDRV